MGTIPVQRGILLSCIGSDAKSEIIIAITNSYGCNCPIWRFPIILIVNITIEYIIIVLIKLTTFVNSLFFCPFRTECFAYIFCFFIQNILRINKFREDEL